VLHQRSKKRNVVPDPLDGEGIKRIGLRGERRITRRGMG
jgi:hypothetical protein